RAPSARPASAARISCWRPWSARPWRNGLWRIRPATWTWRLSAWRASPRRNRRPPPRPPNRGRGLQEQTAEEGMLRLTDLREILRYVPRFRDRVFVIALDGAIIEHENFRNLLLDIALLRSLRIGVALVHGAGHQIRHLAEQTGQTPSTIDGTGVTDAVTLQLALTAANRVTHETLEGLSANDLRGACSNALVAHPAGILHGVDHQHTGRV